MKEKYETLQEIETENFVWIIYLFIIGLSFVANKFESQYYKTGNIDSKEKYRLLNIFIFGVVLLIYLYFFKANYNKVKSLNSFDSQEKRLFSNLNYIASILVVIAGIIFFYIALFDENLETEIAFN